MKTIIQLKYLLSLREKKQAILLLIMILIMALLDVIGVASILPFMAVLSNPEIVNSNPIMSWIYQEFAFEDINQFLFVMGLSVFFVLLASLAFKALTTYAQLRFALMREYSIGKRLMEMYLHQPYSWFLSRNGSELGKNILSEVNKIVGNGLMPMMTLVAQTSVAVAIIALLIIVDYKLALTIGLVLMVVYGLLIRLTRGILNKIGIESFRSNEMRHRMLYESFGATKEVKIGGLENVYIHRFSAPAKSFAIQNASSQIIGQLPRFGLEALVFGGMLAVILYLMIKNNGIIEAIPIITLYAFAGYRLMPALQQIYLAITQIRFAEQSINTLYNDLINLQANEKKSEKDFEESTSEIRLKKSIVLRDVNFSYPGSDKLTIKDLNINIAAKTTVGIVGSTGSGKTTTVDLILGLLAPNEGMLIVDKIQITEENRKNWQKNIGYIPQQIYLSDDTIAANIAFGVNPTDIDEKSLRRAAKIANLDTYISELPEKYQTRVGERGVRLSGGQRQRIGIARALYHNPQVLILDEATSALDNLTEQAVMDAINNLGKEITIVLIAHRLSTIKACDKIFMIDNGQLIASGTFEELKASCETFKKMSME